MMEMEIVLAKAQLRNSIYGHLYSSHNKKSQYVYMDSWSKTYSRT